MPYRFMITINKLRRVSKVVSKIKLRIGDGLVWTVGLTVEVKLLFQLSAA